MILSGISKCAGLTLIPRTRKMELQKETPVVCVNHKEFMDNWPNVRAIINHFYVTRNLI